MRISLSGVQENRYERGAQLVVQYCKLLHELALVLVYRNADLRFNNYLLLTCSVNFSVTTLHCFKGSDTVAFWLY